MKAGPFGTLPEGDPRGDADNNIESEELVPVVTDDDVCGDVGVLRGEPADVDGSRGSAAGTGPVVPVGESAREPIAAVSMKERAHRSEKAYSWWNEGGGRTSGGDRVRQA